MRKFLVFFKHEFLKSVTMDRVSSFYVHRLYYYDVKIIAKLELSDGYVPSGCFEPIRTTVRTRS